MNMMKNKDLDFGVALVSGSIKKASKMCLSILSLNFLADTSKNYILECRHSWYNIEYWNKTTHQQFSLHGLHEYWLSKQQSCALDVTVKYQKVSVSYWICVHYGYMKGLHVSVLHGQYIYKCSKFQVFFSCVCDSFIICVGDSMIIWV